MKKIYTENVIQEQWGIISQYYYPENIKRYLKKNGINNENEGFVNSVASNFVQSREYFKTASEVSLNTSPVLLYYGVTNLLFAAFSLRLGKGLNIESHGMTIDTKTIKDHIGDLEIITSSKQDAAFYRFCSFLGEPKDLIFVVWKLKEVLSSIPDLAEAFKMAYPNAVSKYIPIDVIKSKNDYVEIINKNEIENLEGKSLAEAVYNFNLCYLAPQFTGDKMILRRKLESQDIAICSLSGRKFLQVSHIKQAKRAPLPVLIYVYIGLFSLCSLSRYYANIWFPFIQKDTTGEKLLIERFLQFVQRYVPNIIINILLDDEVIFSNERVKDLDMTKEITEKEIKELSKNEALKVLNKLIVKGH